ncbi:Vitamin B12 import system permease protein BtuC, partial [human gut metagenome]
TDHRVLLPGCALAGASALLLADVVARLALAAAELPIGVVTATLGAPAFMPSDRRFSMRHNEENQAVSPAVRESLPDVE